MIGVVAAYELDGVDILDEIHIENTSCFRANQALLILLIHRDGHDSRVDLLRYKDIKVSWNDIRVHYLVLCHQAVRTAKDYRLAAHIDHSNLALGNPGTCLNIVIFVFVEIERDKLAFACSDDCIVHKGAVLEPVFRFLFDEVSEGDGQEVGTIQLLGSTHIKQRYLLALNVVPPKCQGTAIANRNELNARPCDIWINFYLIDSIVT